MQSVNPTAELYGQLQLIASHFNDALFEGQLPSTILTLSRSRTSAGYFSASKWRSMNGVTAHELSLNPAFFSTRPLLSLFQTVAHELCHLWQQLDGSASRPGYHNKKWADQMQNIGLMPSSTGLPGGAITGQKISDYPIIGGEFLNACESLFVQGFNFSWTKLDRPLPDAYKVMSEQMAVNLRGHVSPELLIPLCDFFPNIELQSMAGDAGKKIKIKYSCPICECNVWGKPGLSIICGECKTSLMSQCPDK